MIKKFKSIIKKDLIISNDNKGKMIGGFYSFSNSYMITSNFKSINSASICTNDGDCSNSKNSGVGCNNAQTCPKIY
jgi:hypothetical protein